MDYKLSSALHILVLVSEADSPMSSEEIAVSVGTNPSYIRKITVLLKKADILISHQGKRGFSLLGDPDQITLFMIYQAIYETDHVTLFDIHHNPNDECIVGKHIKPVLSALFRDGENETEAKLKRMTLNDIITSLRKEAGLVEGE